MGLCMNSHGIQVSVATMPINKASSNSVAYGTTSISLALRAAGRQFWRSALAGHTRVWGQ